MDRACSACSREKHSRRAALGRIGDGGIYFHATERAKRPNGHTAGSRARSSTTCSLGIPAPFQQRSLGALRITWAEARVAALALRPRSFHSRGARGSAGGGFRTALTVVSLARRCARQRSSVHAQEFIPALSWWFVRNRRRLGLLLPRRLWRIVVRKRRRPECLALAVENVCATHLGDFL
jgi:hypothetical protein